MGEESAVELGRDGVLVPADLGRVGLRGGRNWPSLKAESGRSLAMPVGPESPRSGCYCTVIAGHGRGILTRPPRRRV